jgi:membrane-associated phospholipid phosphatase
MTPRSRVNSPALRVLALYLVFASTLAAWSWVRGDGGSVAVAAYAIVGVASAFAARSAGRGGRVLRDWLPLLALPILYGAIPRTALRVGPFDPWMQGLDRLVFGADAARAFATAAPFQPLSELLHAAYFSYYAIIYVPPMLMYVRGDIEAFQRTVGAFTVAMVVCFMVFCLFPVEGPRYAWAPAPAPDGLMRRIVLTILEEGSSRGTAFPSSHQAIALAISASSLAWDRRLGLVVMSASVLLGFGAVYGGFHYAVDMIAGAAVGIGAYLAWGREGWARLNRCGSKR